MDKDIKGLLDFISASPTAFHAAANITAALDAAGYTRLYEGEKWEIGCGKYYVTRNSSSVIALNIPKRDFRGFMIMAGHTDSPTYKVKENPEDKTAGAYIRLGVERYGDMIAYSWLDRPLSVAGRVIVRDGEALKERLVNIDRDLVLIPSLAIHMDRSVNDGKKFDPNTDMLPLYACTGGEKSFSELVAETVGVKAEDILGTELMLYPRTHGAVWGAEEEFVSSPRLDDLQCMYACLQGFLSAEPTESASVLCAFDNEEVGSDTKQGAGSAFFEDILFRVCECLGRSREAYYAAINQSFMVSADNAHSVHPNHPEYSDRNDRPVINQGIVIKYNSNRRYTTDAVSGAVFAELCERAGVPFQYFSNRADLAGGSTLGHISTTRVPVEAVDIGLAQLAMHSAYETAGVKDTKYLMCAAREFFSRSFRRDREGMKL